MGKRLFLLILVAMLFLSGCAAAPTTAPAANKSMDGRSSYGEAAPQVPAAEAPAAPAEPQAVTGGSTGSGVAGGQGDAGLPEVKRLVIRNANLTIIVADPGTTMSAIMRMTENMNGYVVTSNLYKTTTRKGVEVPQATITVRVPADKLNDAMDQIKKQVKDPSKDVRSENISGQDVTKEYTDLNSRLKNLQDTEAQLREIMASATKTEDVLSVYNQLTQIREQIEVIKGQIKYYEESAAMSSIAVEIVAQASVEPLEVGGWQPVGVARNAVQALIDTMQFLGSAAIWLILFALPVGLVIFIPLWLLFRLIRRGRKPRPQVPTPPATTA